MDEVNETRPPTAPVPFEPKHKFMGTVHEYDGRGGLYMKGAPDRLSPMVVGQFKSNSMADYRFSIDRGLCFNFCKM